MARYIDAEKLWNDRPPFPKDQSDDYVLGFNECMWAFSKLIREQINNAPTDVAPRAEVAREIFAEIEKLFHILVGNETGKEFYSLVASKYAELKKKYTEEQK